MNAKPSIPRRHGFRFSPVDAVILLAGIGVSWWLARQNFPLWWIVPAAVGHFFLFCNVFLVWPRLELLWAAVFVVNVAAHVAAEVPGPWPSLLWQMPVTLLVIVWQMRSPWYHGIFARRINLRLADYLDHTL